MKILAEPQPYVPIDAGRRPSTTPMTGPRTRARASLPHEKASRETASAALETTTLPDDASREFNGVSSDAVASVDWMLSQLPSDLLSQELSVTQVLCFF